MELSIFLAKLFGIYMLAVGVLWALRGDMLAQVIEEFFDNRALVFVSGLLALVVGIAIAIGHSVWEPNWRGLITLFGYLSILRGVARISFPDVPRKRAIGLVSGGSRWVLLVFVLAVGGYLTWAGFTQG
jgi:hypothetical protein